MEPDGKVTKGGKFMKIIIELNLDKRVLKVFNKKTKRMYLLTDVIGINFLAKEDLLVVTFAKGKKHYYNSDFELVDIAEFKGNELISLKE